MSSMKVVSCLAMAALMLQAVAAYPYYSGGYEVTQAGGPNQYQPGLNALPQNGLALQPVGLQNTPYISGQLLPASSNYNYPINNQASSPSFAYGSYNPLLSAQQANYQDASFNGLYQGPSYSSNYINYPGNLNSPNLNAVTFNDNSNSNYPSAVPFNSNANGANSAIRYNQFPGPQSAIPY